LAALVAACNSAGLTTPSGVGPTGAPAAPDGDDDDTPADAGKKKKTSTTDAGATAGDDDDDTSSPPPKAVDLTMSKNVTIQVQPTDYGAAILNAIKGAQTSVHMTIYLLTDTKIIDALGDLKDAGKDVKVILNKTFPPDGGDNTDAFDALEARGVDVVWASPQYTYTHAKTIVIDAKKAIIMTMNLTASSPKTNREYIATDGDADDVATLEKVFAADHDGKGITVASKLVISPAAANSNGSPRDFLAGLVSSAKKSVDVEVQSLSDRAIVDAILAQHAAGLDVHVVIDGDVSDTNAQVTVINKLKTAGVPLRSLHTPDCHAKAIVVDGARLYVGSQNFTATALDTNREVGVLTDAAAEVTKVRTQIETDFANGVEL
jgi:phosphatidylserine/phosphatidylglycerophosphate/cardiolipin synthase-like enzyme